ncbi:phosphate acyltransferase PlsX [Endozoicomonas ascidiicola]|uniref:phosphate acyltransferase PlsX n=1 Tax=Endozoicomonas ascidiicola TaxID=1698521 RepID=UPI000AB46872|nr:phosphate acyltransferase PlsX [Endozoicomonas ascidiicola]
MPGRSPNSGQAAPGRRISLDIMSGDESPRSRIRAALRALDAYSDLHLILVGNQKLITEHLSSASFDQSRLHIVHAEKTIGMDDKPSAALRGREGSSMWLALEQVADGHAAACVSSGNTGALMAMGRFALKTFVGIDRPAIAAAVPCKGGSALLLDMGANVDCSATNLYQFAVMGSQLVASVNELDAPRVGLLNVGTEDIKGNEQVRLADRLLKEDGRLNYIGYIEGHDVFAGKADVVVCDGFVGNVTLKTGEGVANLIRDTLLDAFQQTLWRRFLALIVAPVLRKLYRSIDPVVYNGASFLGLQGIVVKSHGHSDEEGFYRAIQEAVREVDSDVTGRLSEEVESMLKGD